MSKLTKCNPCGATTEAPSPISSDKWIQIRLVSSSSEQVLSLNKIIDVCPHCQAKLNLTPAIIEEDDSPAKKLEDTIYAMCETLVEEAMENQ